MKKGLIGKLVVVIILAILSFFISYYVTSFLDRNLFKPIDLLITFEDTKDFTLENTNKMTKEEALLIYPYTFEIKNNGASVDYQIILEDLKKENISRDDLEFILVRDGKEVKSGNLLYLKNNIIYKTNILEDEVSKYQLYVYVTSNKEEIYYQYQIKVMTD